MVLIDLSIQIENHCEKCRSIETSQCKFCFFNIVELNKLNLGSNRIYRRAYHYLRTLNETGFMRAVTFGTHLNIPKERFTMT